jgi:metallo-beta-lactamase class B
MRIGVQGAAMTGVKARGAMRFSGLVVLAGLAWASQSSGQADSVSRSWNEPVAPFRIIDRIYYVGARDISSFLIATDAGLIVIDGGFVETAPQILRNIATLGFKPGDVKILLSSHAHYDHAGGLAELKRATGARLYVSAPDAVMLARGGLNDFGFGNRFPFPAVTADSAFVDGALIRLGGVSMKANVTPGHTRGCTTWTMTVREKAKDYAALFLCSTSVPGYQLVGNPAYPGIVEDYESTFARLRTMPCDVLLGAHGNFFHLTEKREALKQRGDHNPFIDPAGCRSDIESSERSFRRTVEQQRGR